LEIIVCQGRFKLHMALQSERLAAIEQHFVWTPRIFLSQENDQSLESFVLMFDVWIDRDRAGGDVVIHLKVLPMVWRFSHSRKSAPFEFVELPTLLGRIVYGKIVDHGQSSIPD
jgi:hypothetical protein